MAMATIMVVEDVAIFREPIAATLQLAGYTPVCATNGQEALAKLKTEAADLILLDLAMPQMDGITFLRYLRADRKLAKTPVILLTAVTDRDRIVEAGKLGVQECMLKSRFSTKELIARIEKQLRTGSTEAAAPQAAGVGAERSGGKAEAVAAGKAAASGRSRPTGAERVAAAVGVEIPSLLTRENALARAERAMEATTLSGVVAQVISLAASPRSDLTSLAGLISRDAALAAKTLQAANSAAYTSNAGPVLNIEEAVRRIGCATVRNLAATLGVFDSMPPANDSEFNFVRCWQHSLAVATLCERLVGQSEDPDSGSVAYLIGLCHDLGQILFHTQFQAEYAQVLEYEHKTGKARDVLERIMLGVTHQDLITLILGRIGLPDNIREPIEEFHNPSARGGKRSPLTKVLKLAEGYANGLMLGTSERCGITPFTRGECKAAVGRDDPEAPTAEAFRGEILAQTMTLARLSAAAERALTAPLFPKSSVRIWLVRDSMCSRFDPVMTALSSIGQVDVYEQLPSPQEAAAYDRVVVVARHAAVFNLGTADMKKVAAEKPCLWLLGKHEASAPVASPELVRTWPVAMADLAEFVEMKGEERQAA
jgi:HD-like signal output (HDOD) protein/CheY-like chemotaxis protein